MFELQTLNELTLVAQGEDVMFAKKSAMIAYQGDFKFEKLLFGPQSNIFSAVFGSLKRHLTGENLPLVKVSGSGTCYFADNGRHIVVIHMEAGENIGVESNNLLAFTQECEYTVRFIGSGILSQKGLFTTNIKAREDGAQVAILSDGNPIIIESPCCVDPDVIICWNGPDPVLKLDVNWKTFIGQTSGESYMFEFKQPGQTVVVQPRERQSGLKIGISDKRYEPQIHGSVYGSAQQQAGTLDEETEIDDAKGNEGERASHRAAHGGIFHRS